MSLCPRNDGAGRPVVDFDHHTPVDILDPDEAYRDLRAACPVAYSEHHGGYWIVSKYDDVARVLKDHENFSSANNEFVPDGTPTQHPVSPFKLMVPESLDPPEFFIYRRMLNGILSAKAVAEMVPRIEYWATYLIDQIIEQGTADLVYDIASPLPGSVSLEWIGFPREDWERVSRAYHDVSSYPASEPRFHEALADLDWLDGRIAEEVAGARTRARPRDDVIAFVVSREVAGEPISDEYAEAMIRILIGGGVDTTTSLLSAALVHLHRFPQDRETLRARPELWDSAMDEFMRRYPPVRTHARTVMHDVELGGHTLRRGDRVVVSEGSAGHDEDRFSRPFDVILDRAEARHLGFGLGVHRCPGTHLARAEFNALMPQILERMPDYTIDETQLQRFHVESQVAGWLSVKATFAPGPRRLPS